MDAAHVFRSDDLERILEGSVRRSVARGALLLEEGSRGGGFFVVRSGLVSIERWSAGKQILLASLGPGEFFGEMSILEDTASVARVVVASERAEVDVIPRETVLARLAADHELAARAYREMALTLSRRLRQLGAIVPALLAGH